ncbi:hypothetical protein K3495_g7374 [Podosphaera aphanis]|nr:hypothetical protein K3495_g7374 [Podosphaera aphanis]
MDTDKQQAFKSVSTPHNKFQVVAEHLVEQAFTARKSHNRSPLNFNCFKCGSNRHVSIPCSYAEIGFDAARKARIRREGEESDEDTKVYQPPRSYITRSKDHKSSLLPEDNFRSSNSNCRNGKSSSRLRLNSPRPHYYTKEQARLADKPSDDDSGTEIDEFGGLSWEQRTKTPESITAFETSEEILTPHDPSVTCPDPKFNAYLDSKTLAHPYAEADGGAYIKQSEFSNGINKREQNTVLKNIRKVKSGHLNAHGSRNGRRLQEEALSLLHTVCDIKKINIPERILLCVTCAAQKIKKKQPKKLAEHALESLALISFDVAGPFPPSYRGYRYFGEIVDNWRRKTWTLLLKDRNEILSALNKWKLKVELQIGMKVRASRTDNAPEIIQTLKQWENEGVSVQHTEPHTSAQNGPAKRSIHLTGASI